MTVKLHILGIIHLAPTALPLKASVLESSGYVGAGGKTLRLGKLNHWLAQEAAHLLVIQQELLDLFAEILFRAGDSQKRRPLYRRLLQHCIEHSLGPLPLVRRDFHGTVSALRISRPSHSSIRA